MLVHILLNGKEQYATESEMDSIILDARFAGTTLEVLEYITINKGE